MNNETVKVSTTRTGANGNQTETHTLRSGRVITKAAASPNIVAIEKKNVSSNSPRSSTSEIPTTKGANDENNS